MTTATETIASRGRPAGGGPLRALAALLHRREGLSLLLLLAPPLLWFGVVYLGSLLALVWQSGSTFDDFSMTVLPARTWANYRALLGAANLDVVGRTLGMAAVVTLACAVLAFPLAYYMARHADGALKGFLYVAVMLPMWASYIVKAYAWTVILAKGGVVYWFAGKLGLLPALEWVLGTVPLAPRELGRAALTAALVFAAVEADKIVARLGTPSHRGAG